MTTSRRFWPTPNAADAVKGGMRHKGGNPTLRGATEGGLTSSPEASPASPSPRPESSGELTTTAISGLNLLGLWPPSGPVGACLKMCLASSTWRVALSGYGLTWKQKITKSGRLLYRLQLSVPRTNGTASGLSPQTWPTPDARDAQPEGYEAGLRRKEKHSTWGLQTAVVHSMWPTPQAQLTKHGTPSPAQMARHDSLDTEVFKQMLHTPTSKANQMAPSMAERDAGSYGHGMMPTPSTPAELAAAYGGDYMTMEEADQSVKRGMAKLSAAWVSRLMGYPDSWMDDLPLDPLGQTGKTASPASRRTKKTG